MYEIQQQIIMLGFGRNYDLDSQYYDRIVDTKILEVCKDEFEVADYFSKNISNMSMEFMLSIHNLKDGEEYIHKLDFTGRNDRLKTVSKDIMVGFKVNVVVLRK